MVRLAKEKIIRNLLNLLFMMALLFGSVLAQEKSKIDTVLQNQNTMMQNQQKILQQVTWIDPLEDRHFGLEFNPALLLVGFGNNDLYLSGGFSLFNIAPQAELAFPVYFRENTSASTTLLTVDAQYRLFFTKHRGFFASAGLRFARLTGKAENSYNEIAVNKLGAAFGIGYRYFSRLGIFWGTNIIMGTYFSDDHNKLDKFFFDEGKFLLDFELLKIGYAF